MFHVFFFYFAENMKYIFYTTHEQIRASNKIIGYKQQK